MIRGLYTSASGMKALETSMDTVSNNLANLDTTGYKRDVSVQKAFSEMLIRRTNDEVLTLPIGSIDTAPVVGKLGLGVEYNEAFTVFEQGSLEQTGNDFDLSLDTEGFFAVDTPHGVRYTRNGSFMLGKEGLLVTKEGYPVLSEEGEPIALKKNNFYVDVEGNIYQNPRYADSESRLVTAEENDWEEEELVARLDLVNFNRPRYLEKQGSSLWRDTEYSGYAMRTDRPGVHQGYLEASNVNPVDEMVSMIKINRAYESNQKVITTQDDLLSQLISKGMNF